MAEAGVTIDQIDELAHGFDYAPYAAIYALDPGSHDLYRDVYSREALLALVARDFPDFPAERVHHVDHHLAHAASAYYTSGWDECLVVVIDGMGEAHSVSVYGARDGRLDLIFRVAAQDSIGILYSLVTLQDRKSTRLNSSHTVISYAVFCLKKKTSKQGRHSHLPK